MNITGQQVITDHPSVHRRALITWIAVFPTITITLVLIGPMTARTPLPFRTLILTIIVVYLLVPALTETIRRLSARMHS
ncbi:hypothetical protein [Nocardia aurantiaca]|uniref:Uncharacterized protein n=1 Tax=Nocardia aurantiaca TaxID=2675850 RepID=A0A6I3KVU7_9NOCA|nr:hypothetical protein [Nocardia aurantiaca]MTE14112.1 hypothetical protein [Nocardia aurantiaca]